MILEQVLLFYALSRNDLSCRFGLLFGFANVILGYKLFSNHLTWKRFLGRL